MPYDLYGTYYASRIDAENAEMAQCAAIDADISARRIDDLERELQNQQQPANIDEQIHNLNSRIASLEERIEKLEKSLS